MAPFVNIHTHHKVKAEGIEVIALNPEEWKDNTYSEKELYSVGIHPWHSNSSTIAAQLQWLEEALQKKNVLLLGEVGLDRSIAIPLPIQKAVLRSQLELSRNYSKPLVFHAVKSISDILAICKQEKVQQPFIVHGFTGKPDAVQQVHRAKGYVSFGAKIIENRSWDDALKEAYKLKNIFFETDESTVPIELVYQKASEVLGIALAVLKEQVYAYFCTVLEK